MENKRNYCVLNSSSNVSLRVPKEGSYMKLIEAHSFNLGENIIEVQEHWRNSFLAPGTPQIIQRNFFGISSQDLGKKIIATVEVVEKTTSRGRKVMLLNITKVAGVKATSDLKFSEIGDGIELPGTKIKIAFQAR